MTTAPTETASAGEALISVIVPVFNTANYLPRCLDSICGQSYPQLEIIVVDDGSTDASASICSRYAARDPRIRLLRQENSGVSAARNAGLALASGAYLAFVDSDDFIAPDYFERLLDSLLKSQADLCFCYAYDFDPDTQAMSAPAALRYMQQHPELPQLAVIASGCYDFISPTDLHDVIWGALYRRACCAGIYFDASLHIAEDSLWIAEVIRRSRTLCSLRKPLYYYTIRTGSAVHRAYSARREDELRAWRTICALYRNAQHSDLAYALRLLSFFRIYRSDPGFSAENAKRLLSLYQPMQKKLIRRRIASHQYAKAAKTAIWGLIWHWTIFKKRCFRAGYANGPH